MWPAVDLRELRVFLVLCEELHFARTADRLLLTPSRVSQAIRALEDRIGGRLFERTSRRVRLTPLGEQLRTALAPLYEQMEQAYASVREAATGVAGCVRIGMYNPVNGGPRLAEIVEAFRARHPACSVAMIDTSRAPAQLDALRRGDVDLMAVRLPVSEPDVELGRELSCDERVLAVARDHPLAARESVGWEDVGDFAVTDNPTLPRELMDAFAPPRTPTGRAVPRVVVHSYGEVLMRVANGELVHPTVRPFLRYFAHPGVRAVPIRDLPPSTTALAWLRDRVSPAARAFARVAEDVLADGR